MKYHTCLTFHKLSITTEHARRRIPIRGTPAMQGNRKYFLKMTFGGTELGIVESVFQ